MSLHRNIRFNLPTGAVIHSAVLTAADGIDSHLVRADSGRNGGAPITLFNTVQDVNEQTLFTDKQQAEDACCYISEFVTIAAPVIFRAGNPQCPSIRR
jgi:hypothetical protein